MKKLSTRTLLLIAAFALFIVPVVAFAAGGFDDVDDDNVFVADIQWMKDTGITKGCNPPSNTKFCPEKAVTRQQMSAFMHRLATKQVVDAGTLDGMDATDMIRIEGVVVGEVDGIAATETVASTTINVPVAGVLAINASIWLEDDCSDFLPSYAWLGLVVNGTIVSEFGAGLPDCQSADEITDLSSMTAVVEVPAGNTTVEVTVNGQPLVWVGETGLSIVFSPFGSGATLTGATHTRPSQ